MDKSMLKVVPAAAALALALLAPAARAEAPAKDASRDTGVSYVIAEQGNAALRAIREDLKVAVRVSAPARPRVKMHAVAGPQPPKRSKGRA